MRWQFLIDEFGPTIQYSEGPKTIVADVLSRLNLCLCPAISKTWWIVMDLIRMIYQAMPF